MPRSAPVDGFSLAYDRSGVGPAVVLLHGWPGTRADFRALVPLLTGATDVVVPDLRGFGESDTHAVKPGEGYSAAAQARSVVGLMDELALDRVVIAGYDIGSRVAHTVARTVPERVRALVLAPPLPGAGDRVLSADAQREFWYGVEDLDPAEQHDLVDVQVPQDDYQDCVTGPGLAAAGLPDEYGPWPDCQAVGATSRADGRPGVACRSAAVRAPAGEEELAVFDTHAPGVAMTGRTPFADWYLA